MMSLKFDETISGAFWTLMNPEKSSGTKRLNVLKI